MSHLQTRHIEGTLTTTGAAPKRAISIPLLPKDGAWSITGHLIAVGPGAPRQAVTFYPQLTGVCDGGVVTPNNGNKLRSQPMDGGRAQNWAPGGLTLTVSGQQMEIELAGVEDKPVLWAWSLDVVVLAMTAEAPSSELATKSAA